MYSTTVFTSLQLLALKTEIMFWKGGFSFFFLLAIADYSSCSVIPKIRAPALYDKECFKESFPLRQTGMLFCFQNCSGFSLFKFIFGLFGVKMSNISISALLSFPNLAKTNHLVST